MARSERSTPSFVTRHAARGGLVALGALLTACASLLGIEDLSPDPDPAKGGAGQAGSAAGATGGKAGSTGTGGSAGTPGGRGGTSGSSGAAGAAARAGSPNGGSAGAGVGGSSGAGGSTGGSAGSGGTVAGSGGEAGMAPETGTVSGTIIDFWRHPLQNVPVRIGDETATTDASGKFVIEDVPATYDAAFVVVTEEPRRVFEWVFLGLSRRDPTLQVIEGFDSYEAHFYVTQVYGGVFEDGRWLLGIGSDNGADAASSNSAGFDRRPYWWGPAINDWTLHSLFLERMGELPSSYIAYETKTTTTDANTTLVQQDFEMNLTEQDLDTASISGAIVDDTGVGRTNSLFVRFTTGAALPLVDRVTASANSYQYLVPDLPNGTITVAAAETHDDGSYAIAHRDGNMVDSTGVDIVIPSPASALVPPDEATLVGPDTVLSFAAGDPGNSCYVVHIENEEYQQGVFIVTANRQVTLGDVPLVNNMNVISPNAWHNWHVQTHGQFDSVDDMTGSTGYLDAFTTNNYRPQGPSRSSGAYTASYVSDFQTAP